MEGGGYSQSEAPILISPFYIISRLLFYFQIIDSFHGIIEHNDVIIDRLGYIICHVDDVIDIADEIIIDYINDISIDIHEST